MLTAKQRDTLLSFERDSKATDLCDLSDGFQISCGVRCHGHSAMRRNRPTRLAA